MRARKKTTCAIVIGRQIGEGVSSWDYGIKMEVEEFKENFDVDEWLNNMEQFF